MWVFRSFCTRLSDSKRLETALEKITLKVTTLASLKTLMVKMVRYLPTLVTLKNQPREGLQVATILVTLDFLFQAVVYLKVVPT